MNFFTRPIFIFFKEKVFLIILLISLSIQAQSNLLAFPTAKGAGAYTTGGRGGIVVHVTNNNISGPGSFTEAMQMTVPRIIVFDVSGQFPINKLLYLDTDNSNFTLAGQTAPEGGVTIVGGRVFLSSVNNYIIRHVRFKGGFEADTIPNSGDNNGSASYTGVGDQLDIIVDHVSFGFGSTMPTWTPQGDNDDDINNVTVQNCLFAESDKGAIIGKDVVPSTYRVTGSASFINNIFYNVKYRTPNTNANHDDNNSFDVINNLTWNAQGRFIRAAGDLNLNHINNAIYQRTYSLNDVNLNLYEDNNWDPNIYTNGNLLDVTSIGGNLTNTIAEMNADNTLSWKFFVGSNYGVQLPSNYFTDTPFPIRGVAPTILDASVLRTTLPNQVGCNARLNADGSVSNNLDVHDASYLNNILNDVMVAPIDEGNYAVSPITVISREADYYVTNAHIPELWLQANVNNPSATSHTELAPSGYTWIEEFLNQVDYNVLGEVLPQSVELTPSATTMEVNQTLQLSTTFAPLNTTNQNGTWSSSDPTIASVDENGSVNALAPGDVIISFVSLVDSDVNANSAITVFAEALVASAGNDQDICNGETTTLTASGGSSFLWDTGETTASIDVNPSITTTYTVTVFDNQGNSDEDSVTVTVNLNPNVVIQNGDSVNIMNGDFVTLTATGANSYEWNNGATQPNIAVSPSQTTIYEVRGFINDCYDDKQVTVNVIPEVEADAGEDVEICLGESVTLTANGGDDYEWSTGESTQSIQVSPDSTTEYTVTVFNALDFDEDSVIVFVDDDCNENDNNSNQPEVPEGEAGEFSFDVFPNPSTNEVNVRLSGTVALSRIYLYDITGKLIHSEIIANEDLSMSTTRTIDVSTLHPGLYYVRLVDIKQDITKRLIKN